MRLSILSGESILFIMCDLDFMLASFLGSSPLHVKFSNDLRTVLQCKNVDSL